MKKKYSNLLIKFLELNSLLIIFFLLFLIFYLINFNKFNSLFATDFIKWYKPNSIIIIEQLFNFKFNIDEYSSFSIFYLIPKLF